MRQPVAATIWFLLACGRANSHGREEIRGSGKEAGVTEVAVIARVGVAGAEPGTVVILQDSAGRRHTAQGAQVPLLRSVDGATARVNGILLEGDRFDVVSFEVVEVAGLPAFDGVVEQRGDSLVLRMRSGLGPTVAKAHLMGRVGQRVWITVDRNGGVHTIGRIAPFRPTGGV